VQENYETGQYVFNQGDLGDRLFIIIKGKIEVIQTNDRISRKLAESGPGEYFGEMALMVEGQATRGAAVRALEPLDVLSVPRHDINALVKYIPALRESLEKTIQIRQAANDEVVRRSTVGQDENADETVHLRR
jgi:CRP-like cAMP-binding protein